ncbi:hypothetical protein [Chitinophaga pinensis]|uniref:Uncharacterized protein n=1 Tax=Chitinophaga pinensis TaxID=79329 RepID=A0A5C6LJ28_9BACT|nr:hypothetical protein [Chitinophaga pinensis]TWV91984.1 hypothetical protein FEF09_28560 [Chitinophaga pinensis]
MKRTTLVSFLLVGVLFTFNACKKETAAPVQTTTPEDKTTVTVENGRLAFKTTKDFYEHIDAATPDAAPAGFHTLYAALKEAYGEPGKDKKPVLSATLTDLEAFNFPTAFLATLNEKGEVKVGDEIIWYHNGNKYFIPVTDEASLETTKQKPERIKKFIPTKVSLLGARTQLDIRGLNARHQYAFQPTDRFTGAPLTGSARKFVHEIYGTFDGYYDALPGIKGYKAYIVLRLKMEWQGCCDWNPNASEERTEIININGTATLLGISNNFGNYMAGPNFSISTQKVTRENWDVPLASYNGIGTLTNNNWEIELNGTITSYFNGDVDTNRWINTGALW